MKTRFDAGFTLIELLIVVAIISIIAAVAVPGLLQSKMSGNETSAATTLRTLNVAQVAYASGCGHEGYAVAFPVLATPPPGQSEAFLSAEFNTEVPTKAGYRFTLAPGEGAVDGQPDCNGTATKTAYYATGTPVAFGSTGGRSFATTQRNSIWQQYAAAAPTEPFGTPAIPY